MLLSSIVNVLFSRMECPSYPASGRSSKKIRHREGWRIRGLDARDLNVGVATLGMFVRVVARLAPFGVMEMTLIGKVFLCFNCEDEFFLAVAAYENS